MMTLILVDIRMIVSAIAFTTKTGKGGRKMTRTLPVVLSLLYVCLVLLFLCLI